MTTTEFVFTEIEWHTSLSGTEVLMEALRAAGDTAYAETAFPLAGAEVLCLDVDEPRLFFTVGVPDGGANAYFNALRAGGLRVKETLVIPERLARAQAHQVFAWIADNEDRARERELAFV